MTHQGTLVCACVCLVTVSATVAGRQPGPARRGSGEGVYTTAVGRFGGARRGTCWRKPVLRVTVLHPVRKAARSLAVPKQDWLSGAYDPVPHIVERVKKLKKGDYIKYTTVVLSGEVLIHDLSPYRLQEGEDDPDACLFEGSRELRKGRTPCLVVTLSRFAEKTEAMLPTVKGPDGKPRPHPDMARTVSTLRKGQVVDVEIAKRRGTAQLEYISPYAPPAVGQFVQVGEQTRDGRRTVNIAIRTSDGPTVFPVVRRGRGRYQAPDPRVVAAAKRLRPGDRVAVKTRRAPEGTVAVKIQKAPAAGKDVAAKGSR